MNLTRYEDLEKDTVRLVGVPVVYGDRAGRNKNLYPSEELRAAVPWWEKMVSLDPTYKYSLIKHPKDTSEESLEYVAGIIEDIYFDESENCLKADFKLLPTTWGLLVSYFSKKNYPVGVSLRGDADPTYTSMSINNKTLAITERRNLKLEGIDFVLYPSFITTQITSSNVSESRSGQKIYKVVEGFKKEYKNILKDDEIEKLNNLYTNLGGNDMEKNTDTSAVDVNGINLDIEKAQVLKDRLEINIDKLKNSLEKEEALLADLQSKTSSAKTELDEVIANITVKTEELDALLKTKISYETEIAAKLADITKITGVIESKTNESKELDELNELKAKSTDTIVMFKKNGVVFSAERKPVISIIAPEDRLSKKEMDATDIEEMQKIAFLNGEMDNCFAKISPDVVSFEKYSHPTYQAFPSNEEGVDFDIVLNTTELNKLSTSMQSKTAMALNTSEKKDVCKYLLDKYTSLDEIGCCEVPTFLKSVTESKITFETTKPYLDALLEGLLFDNIIDLDDSDVREQTDGVENDSEIVISLDEANTVDALQKLGVTLSQILGGEEEIIPVTEPTSVKMIDDEDAKRVVEQFNPADEQLDVEAELTEFVDLLLKNNDDTKTPFSETYELKDGTDVYAMYGVVKDSFANGDYTTALQILKGLTGTIFVNIKNSSQVINVQSTEQVGDIPPTDVVPDATDVTTDIVPEATDDTGKLKLTDVQIINYAFNMSTLILARYEDVQEIFAGIAGEPEVEPEIDEQTQNNAVTSVFENTDTTINDENNETNINTNTNGGVEMDGTKLIEMLKENFEIAEELNEENVLEAVGSIIADFIELNEKHSAMEKEISEAKMTALKEEKSAELVTSGIETSVVESAFAELKTEAEVTAKVAELMATISATTVTESTIKPVISRKGTANPEDIIETGAVDNFDRLMNAI